MYIKEIPKWKPLHERLVDEIYNGKDEEQIKGKGTKYI
jgi:hypothetical protein